MFRAEPQRLVIVFMLDWGICTPPFAYLVLITCFRPQPRLFAIDICAPGFPNIYAPCLLYRLLCPPILALSSPVS